MKLKKLIASQTSLLTPLIDEYLRKREVKAAFIPGQRRIHPSLLSNCTRSIVFHILGKPYIDFISPKMKRVFDNGQAMHDRYNDYIRSIGKFKIIDGKEAIKYPVVDEDLWIDGETDGIVVLDCLDYVLEMKSMRSVDFINLKYDNISERYISQVTPYMGILGIPRALFLFENKDNQMPLEFVIGFDEELWASLVKKIRFIQKCVLEDKYPERQCKVQGENWGCSFQKFCWEMAGD